MAEAIALESLDPATVPLEQIDVSRPELMQTDTHWAYFERLRAEDPVHYCPDSMFGPYWSITRFNDIMEIERNHQDFSSAPGIVLADRPELFRAEGAADLEPNPSSLSTAIRNGHESFEQAGGPRAYFGWPADASAEQGEELLGVLADIVAEEVRAALTAR